MVEMLPVMDASFPGLAGLIPWVTGASPATNVLMIGVALPHTAV